MAYSKVALSKTMELAGEPKVLIKLNKAIQQHIIGQKNLIESLLVGLLCDGHVLIESMPGLAKTTAAKALAQGVDGMFHRVQFTPDLLPSDVIGTDVFNQDTREFIFKKGPIFQNIVLADEINRAPAKVQSALLEAMEEKQVTVGQSSYKLPDLFMVIATQNPIEQEGTYNLPEAQLDRFLLHVVLDYPTHEQEFAIVNLDKNPIIIEQTSQAEVLEARKLVKKIYIDDKLKNYIISVVQATRNPQLYNSELASWINYGASPRASLAALHCAQAYAWLYGEEYVLPEHIKMVWHNVLRHRISLSFEAQADGITKDDAIDALLRVVAIP